MNKVTKKIHFYFYILQEVVVTKLTNNPFDLAVLLLFLFYYENLAVSKLLLLVDVCYFVIKRVSILTFILKKI